MKKTKASRSKRIKPRNKQNPEVDMEATKILRTVGDHEAFYFYEALEKPTGEIAKNLPDFLDKVKSAKTESIMFHVQRRDFENWIEKTLGDPKLARKLESISSLNNDDIRTSICRTVENRIEELRQPLITILANVNSAVLVPPC
jgi:hypothetical protein